MITLPGTGGQKKKDLEKVLTAFKESQLYHTISDKNAIILVTGIAQEFDRPPTLNDYRAIFETHGGRIAGILLDMIGEGIIIKKDNYPFVQYHLTDQYASKAKGLRHTLTEEKGSIQQAP